MARRLRPRPLVATVAVAALSVVGATPQGGALGRGPRSTTACTPSVDLSRWSLNRLAAATVVVPVSAGQVGALAPEARTGYAGILLFGSTAPSTLPATLRRLQAMTPQHLGMLVMTDEEGGGVLRLQNLVAPFPWARTLAATRTPAQIGAIARRVAIQLRAAGVTLDLAPVLDVDARNVEPGASDPDGYRSFGGSVQVVTADGEAFLRGLEAGGVIPVVKHFPGLGGSTGNTDDGPASTRPWPVLRATGVRPFAASIAAGAPAVMVANARVPGLTALPASISSAVLSGVLRRALHFRGLIVTDSLTAGAFAAVPLSPAAAAVDAVAAGADLVLLGPQATAAADAALAVRVAGAIAAAVTRGRLSRATLQAAAGAVLASHGVRACGA